MHKMTSRDPLELTVFHKISLKGESEETEFLTQDGCTKWVYSPKEDVECPFPE